MKLSIVKKVMVGLAAMAGLVLPVGAEVIKVDSIPHTRYLKDFKFSQSEGTLTFTDTFHPELNRDRRYIFVAHKRDANTGFLAEFSYDYGYFYGRYYNGSTHAESIIVPEVDIVLKDSYVNGSGIHHTRFYQWKELRDAGYTNIRFISRYVDYLNELNDYTSYYAGETRTHGVQYINYFDMDFTLGELSWYATSFMHDGSVNTYSNNLTAPKNFDFIRSKDKLTFNVYVLPETKNYIAMECLGGDGISWKTIKGPYGPYDVYDMRNMESTLTSQSSNVESCVIGKRTAMYRWKMYASSIDALVDTLYSDVITLNMLYKLTLGETEHGSQKINGDAAVGYGKAVDLQYKPDEGYEFECWQNEAGECVTSESNNAGDGWMSTSITLVGDTVLSAKFRLYKLTLGETEHGSQKVNGDAAVGYGKAVDLQYKPDEGYEFECWQNEAGECVASESNDASDGWMSTSIALIGDTVLSAKFKPLQYRINWFVPSLEDGATNPWFKIYDYGTMPVAPVSLTSQVEKEDNEKYHYFVKVVPEITAVTQNQDYSIVLDSVLNDLSLHFNLNYAIGEDVSIELAEPNECLDVEKLSLRVYNDEGYSEGFALFNYKTNEWLAGGDGESEVHLWANKWNRFDAGVTLPKTGDCLNDEYVKSVNYAIQNNEDGKALVNIYINGEYSGRDRLDVTNPYISFNYKFATTTYTVTWIVEGETVETDNDVVYGSKPKYDGETPTKAADSKFTYEFSNWEADVEGWTAESVVKSDVKFTAQFKSTEISSSGSSSSVASSDSEGSSSSEIATNSSSSRNDTENSSSSAKDDKSSSSSSAKSNSSSSVKQSSSSAKPASSSSEIATNSSSSRNDTENSSSSSAKPNSSSSVKSSSSGKTDAIFAATQAPKFSLSVAGRNIQIAGARIGSAYAILDMQGRVMTTGSVESANFSVALPRSGSYMVRVGSQIQRVNVR